MNIRRWLLSAMVAMVALSGTQDIIWTKRDPSLASVEVAAVLRNTGAGWFVLNDDVHQSLRIVNVEDKGTFLRVNFDKTYAKVGAVSVAGDETWGPLYGSGASVGLAYFDARVWNRAGTTVKPSTIHAQNGNFFITGTMWEAS
jgi:hypothetical protein